MVNPVSYIHLPVGCDASVGSHHSDGTTGWPPRPLPHAGYYPGISPWPGLHSQAEKRWWVILNGGLKVLNDGGIWWLMLVGHG